MIRLVADLYYYVLSSGRIFFTETSKKSLQSKAETLVWRTNDKVVRKGLLRDNNGFKVKLENGNICVSHPKIQSGKYFEVLSYNKDNILDICQSCKIDKGVVEGDFDIAFMDGPDCTIPYMVQHGSESYDKAWKEFERNLNIMSHKKTKTLKVGHRYDVPSGTFWYLGDLSSPDNPETSNFTVMHAFVSNLSDPGISVKEAYEKIDKILQVKKTSDLSKYSTVGETTLILVESTGTMTDSGLTMSGVDVKENIEDIWDTWISGVTPKNLHKILDNIYRTSGSCILQTIKTIPSLKDALITYIVDNLLVAYDGRNCGSFNVNVSEKDLNKRRANLEGALLSLWPGTKADWLGAKKVLKEIFGINISDLCDEACDRYIQIDFDDFDTFYKYSQRLSVKDSGKYCRSISVRDRTLKTDGGILKGNFKGSLVFGVVRELLNLASENLELVSDSFAYLGVYRYSKKDLPEINAKITLEDVVNYLGGPDKLTDLNKEEILAENFTSINVNFIRNLNFEG